MGNTCRAARRFCQLRLLEKIHHFYLLTISMVFPAEIFNKTHLLSQNHQKLTIFKLKNHFAFYPSLPFYNCPGAQKLVLQNKKNFFLEGTLTHSMQNNRYSKLRVESSPKKIQETIKCPNVLLIPWDSKLALSLNRV